jgi:uncharacterized protein YgiM (DUF1202 family)
MKLSSMQLGRKEKIMVKRFLLLSLLILALAGCSKAAPGAEATATAAATTPEAFPSLPALTPTSSASPTPFAPFAVKPGVDNLNIRSNPGYLFDPLLMAQQTDSLTVQGKAPGGEWIAVQTADGVQGWVFAELLKSDTDLDKVPVREPKDVVLIKGHVQDASGTPIQGVGFELKQDDMTNTVVTDSKGDFYSFLPTTASGTWTVTQTAVACKSNVWSDSSCSTYKAGYTGTVLPQTMSISLPQSNSLAFTWK